MGFTFSGPHIKYGVASEQGAVDAAAVSNGQTVSLLLFPAGEHRMLVAAVDQASNARESAVSFQVSVDIDGLIAATQGTCQSVWITKAGICQSLNAKLLAASGAIARGDYVPARNELEAFLHEMDAQLDKAIEGRAYDLLATGARYVIAHLP